MLVGHEEMKMTSEIKTSPRMTTTMVPAQDVQLSNRSRAGMEGDGGDSVRGGQDGERDVSVL
jgi:hypothetical protein